MNEQPGDFRIVLRAQKHPVPGIVRLRHALKQFLRSYGLRCVHAEEVQSENAPPVEQAIDVEQTG